MKEFWNLLFFVVFTFSLAAAQPQVDDEIKNKNIATLATEGE